MAEDILTRIQQEAARLLQADAYISASPAFPVIANVKGDIAAEAERNAAAPVKLVLDFGDIDLNGSGGQVLIEGAQLIVRVVENVSVNRGASGSRENGLRVAQAVAKCLNGKPAARSESGTQMSGTFVARRIERAMAEPGTNAWHVNFIVRGASLDHAQLTRRAAAALPSGSP